MFDELRKAIWKMTQTLRLRASNEKKKTYGIINECGSGTALTFSPSRQRQTYDSLCSEQKIRDRKSTSPFDCFMRGGHRDSKMLLNVAKFMCSACSSGGRPDIRHHLHPCEVRSARLRSRIDCNLRAGASTNGTNVVHQQPPPPPASPSYRTIAHRRTRCGVAPFVPRD